MNQIKEHTHTHTMTLYWSETNFQSAKNHTKQQIIVLLVFIVFVMAVYCCSLSIFVCAVFFSHERLAMDGSTYVEMHCMYDIVVLMYVRCVCCHVLFSIIRFIMVFFPFELQCVRLLSSNRINFVA